MNNPFNCSGYDVDLFLKKKKNFFRTLCVNNDDDDDNSISHTHTHETKRNPKKKEGTYCAVLINNVPW